MFDISQFANMMINKMVRRNPALMQNPQTRGYIDLIRSGDAKKGSEVAQNLCRTYGTTPQEAYNQATNMFFGKTHMNQNGGR